MREGSDVRALLHAHTRGLPQNGKGQGQTPTIAKETASPLWICQAPSAASIQSPSFLQAKNRSPPPDGTPSDPPDSSVNSMGVIHTAVSKARDHPCSDADDWSREELLAMDDKLLMLL